MLFSAAPASAVEAGCEREAISASASSDDVWLALIQQETCTDGWFVTTVAEVVRLRRQAEGLERGNDIFAVDVGGHPDNRLRVLWLSPHRLQIITPNKSLIGLAKSSHEDIEIVVKYEPDDPVERERFLKEMGLPSY